MKDTGFANGANDHRRGIDFIGVSCSFVCHDGKGHVLLHKRSKHCRDEQGRWDNGGGAHEFGSEDMQFLKVGDLHRKLDDGTPTHWVAVWYAVLVDPEQVKNNEPYKIDDIGWFTYDKLPKPLHSAIHRSLGAAHDAGII